ncbi:MAG: hypothetical protein EAZ57_01320 [Cytophagales bacterium]|nr:MAG: hypothetical protein EAZ67_01955 [Cytophagales bacterium]TAF62090.1 MAG: hypothetical protein EAZ57_01320 [Cytophagales bacterium]
MRSSVWWFFYFFVWTCPAWAQVQYTHEYWNDEQGLPENTVNDILQSQDGYIWIATYEGFCRFDGLNFHNYSKNNLPELKVNLAYCLAEDQDGKLWVGTNGGGLVSFENGKGKSYSMKTGELPSDVVRDVIVDKKNQVWATTDGGLVCIKPDKTIIRLSQSSVGANRLFEDSKGRIWVSNRAGGLLVLENEKLVEQIKPESGLGAETAMAFAEVQGQVWVGSRAGLFKIQNGKAIKCNQLIKPKNEELSVVALHHDPLTDVLYVGTNHAEIFMLKDEKIFEYVSENQSLNLSVNVQAICIDHEGSVWYGLYKAGLHRLKRAKLTTLTPKNSFLTDNIIKLAFVNHKNELFVGTNNNGVDAMTPSHKNYGKALKMNSLSINSLLVDRQDRIWAGTYHGWLQLIENNQLTVIDTTRGLSDDFTSAIYQDHTDSIWIGCYGSGIYRTKDAKKVQKFKESRGNDTLDNAIIRFFYEDSKQNLWVGTNSGLFVIKNNTIVSHYNSKNGLTLDMVLCAYEDLKTGGIWFGTRGGGLNYIKDGKIQATLTEKQGLFNDVVYQIVEDDHSKLWMSCNKGIFSTSLVDLRSFLDKKLRQVNCDAYGKSDGMLSTQCSGGFSPAGAKTKDGRLWFPTVNGLVVIDPPRIKINKVPPPVHITHFIADGKYFEVAKNEKRFEFSGLQQRIEFHYAGLSFLAPEKVRFKFMLDGFDQTWIDSENRRVAYYTKLPYGEYTFRVIACNNDGIWNEVGDSVRIHIPTPFWLRAWFIALCCVVFVTLVIAIIRLRLYRLEKQQKQLKALVDEQTQTIRQEKELVEQKNKQIQEREEETLRQSKIIEQRNEHILDSIHYAKRIQEALLPALSDIKRSFPESFILFAPKDIVSGDAYWFTEFYIYDRHEQLVSNLHILTVFDCTGHGVPGALMTVMGNAMLNEIIRTMRVSSPEEILNTMDKRLKNTLQKSDNKQANDGMEIAIFSYCSIQNNIFFAGAGIPLYRVRQNELHTFVANKQALGSKYGKVHQAYELTKIEDLLPTDTFYMCSDGFQDQFGGSEDRKFFKKNLRALLCQIADQPLEVQKTLLLERHKEWKGENVQTDDVLIVGLKGLQGSKKHSEEAR